MRTLFSLTGILLFILGSGAQSRAFTGTGPTDDIAVEVTLWNDWPAHKFKVPVVPQRKRGKITIEDTVTGGEWAFTGACQGNVCRNGVWITAEAAGNDEASVWITLTFEFEEGRKCEVAKEFRIVKGKSVERKMKCRTAKANVRLSY